MALPGLIISAETFEPLLQTCRRHLRVLATTQVPEIKVVKSLRRALQPPAAPAPARLPAPKNDAQVQHLKDLVDRASTQLMMIRRTLDEAVALKNASRRESDALSVQITAGRGVADDITAQVHAAKEVASRLEAAEKTAAALEALVERINNAHEAIELEIERRLFAQRSAFEQRITRLEQECAQRIRQHELAGV